LGKKGIRESQRGAVDKQMDGTKNVIFQKKVTGKKKGEGAA